MQRALFFISLSISFYCYSQPVTNVENLTIVNLHFNDYDPSIHKSFIDLTIENAVRPINQQLKIADDGTASTTFINIKKRELIFDYENRKFSLIASPNEIINVDLNILELLDWSRFHEFKVTGKNQVTNNLILQHTAYLDSLLRKSTDGFSNNRTTEEEYKVKRLSEMNAHLQKFDSHIQQSKITDETFISWGNAQIKYDAGYNLSIYPFVGKINRKMNEDNDYFRFTTEIKPNPEDKVMYLSFLRYLEMLTTAYQIMANVSDKYEVTRQKLTSDSISFFPVLFKIVKGLPKTEERDLLMAYTFLIDRKIPEQWKDSLVNFTTPKLYRLVTSEEKRSQEDVLSLIRNYDIPEKEKAQLLEVYKGTEGKVIFHDFWFTNCAPCMQELPIYNDLIASTDENVEFIFYGAYMDEEDWMKTRSKFELKGRHHLLTKNQLAFFEKYFGVNGFPYHQLINSKGQIVQERIQGVYKSNFDSLNKLFEKYNLNEAKSVGH